MTEKRFIVSIDNKNGVGLYDGDIRLLYFQFNNIQDATECKDALKHQCSLMNELHEENEELLKDIDRLVEVTGLGIDDIIYKYTEDV